MAFPGEVVSGGMGLSKELVGGIAGVGVAISSALKGFKRVPQGEMGVRTRFGKVKFGKDGEPRVVGAGLHGVLPFTHSIETISVQDRSHDLGDFAFERDDQKYHVKSSITWAVSQEKEHVRRALFETNSLTETVTNICASGLWIVMTSIDRGKINDSREISHDVHEICDEDLLVYGVLLKALRLREVARSEAQVLAGALQRNPPDDMSGRLAVVAGA